MRILLAMRSLEQAEGGPITAAFGLSSSLIARGHDVTITAHDDGTSGGTSSRTQNGITLITFPLTWRSWEHSAEYARWLRSNVEGFDVVVINSMWISHVYFAAKYAQKCGVPYILRPHGCLTTSDVSHHALRKRLYWLMIDREIAERALFVHCTSHQEAVDARALGLTNVENIPLGVEEGLFSLNLSGRVRNNVLFLGRIAEKKGLDILIRAIATDAATQTQLRVDVLGVDHRGLRAGLEQLARELAVEDRVSFHGHLEGEQRNSFLRKSGVLALPSKDENFGLAVAEAMAAGLPVVITPHVSHKDLIETNSAGFVVDRTPAAFGRALTGVAELPDDEYLAMQHRARRAVADSYSWDRTAALIEDALGRRLELGQL